MDLTTLTEDQKKAIALFFFYLIQRDGVKVLIFTSVTIKMI